MGIVAFVLIALLAIAGAASMLLTRTSVHSRLFLVINLFCVAVLYLSLNAEFLAVVQVIVYAGAIVVLFLFVITLLNPGQSETPDRLKNQGLLAGLLAAGLLVVPGPPVVSGPAAARPAAPPPALSRGPNVPRHRP